MDLLKAALACNLKPQVENEDDHAIYMLTRKAVYDGDEKKLGIRIVKKEWQSYHGYTNIGTVTTSAEFASIVSATIYADRHPTKIGPNVQVPDVIYGIRFKCAGGRNCFHDTFSVKWGSASGHTDCSLTLFCDWTHRSKTLATREVDFCSKSAAEDALDASNALISAAKTARTN
ncbi:hypothetical protein GCM10007874_58780 [Labrys miyagiensis]|uniref:Uncharacterized protein n=1 Tax=Labrys miyagiensis TaxID=346912 RepID=A0ABQ6CRB2_9HYPH|nr:hypothetical protein GCM10007874_58780 [Labrys miyagiensis]